MIKELRLTNIVLVEHACVEFTNGFNVISGESGAGKSAIMNALNLIAGERSDTSYIRRGAEKGVVEACFEIDKIDTLLPILNDAGIDHEPGSDLLIRRELAATGKSRAFINNQQAQLSLLKQVADILFDVVGQHANQKLLSLDYHRRSLDLYGDLSDDIKSFSACWEEENKARQQLEALINSEAQRMRDIERCRAEIEELEEAAIKDGEEEEVFAEYTQLSHADELIEKSSDLNRVLTGEKHPILAQLARSKATFEQLVQLAPTLKDALTSYNNALVELEEASHTLRTYEARIETNPARAAQLSDRLETITKIKRKYGNTVEEIHGYLNMTRTKLGQLETADDQIEILQHKLNDLTIESNRLAAIVSDKRKQASKNFAKTLVKELRALNMPKVEIDVEITSQKRTKNGDDKIELYITPNVGEHRVSLRECASGGELSRMMLALQAVLAGKEQIPTIIFDEIDANIGGETATIVGEKLREIGQNHQVLCITHFPQVAKLAEHHIRIFKQEIDGRTVTQVESLDESSHKQELARMLG